MQDLIDLGLIWGTLGCLGGALGGARAIFSCNLARKGPLDSFPCIVGVVWASILAPKLQKSVISAIRKARQTSSVVFASPPSKFDPKRVNLSTHGDPKSWFSHGSCFTFSEMRLFEPSGLLGTFLYHFGVRFGSSGGLCWALFRPIGGEVQR